MDSSLILLESQTGIGERQIERLEQPPDLSFQIVHQSFILHMVNAARQRLIKMIHQLHIGAVELPQIFQAGSEIRIAIEIKGKIGKAASKGVPPYVNDFRAGQHKVDQRSEEHTSELQSLMRISYAVSCLNTKM